jgi:threonine/homoserine/homoserine lactone efflux protein
VLFPIFILAIIAGFGVSVITDFLDAYQSAIRIVGGLILVILAGKIFFSNVVEQINKKGNKSTLWSDFMHTYFLTLSNPLTIIVVGAIFAAGEGKAAMARVDVLLLILGVLIATVSWWLFLVTIVSLFRNKIRLRTLWYLNKITGVLIAIFGLVIFLSAFGIFKF